MLLYEVTHKRGKKQFVKEPTIFVICIARCILTTRLGIQLEKEEKCREEKNGSVYVHYIAQYRSKRAK